MKLHKNRQILRYCIRVIKLLLMRRDEQSRELPVMSYQSDWDVISFTHWL